MNPPRWRRPLLTVIFIAACAIFGWFGGDWLADERPQGTTVPSASQLESSSALDNGYEPYRTPNFLSVAGFAFSNYPISGSLSTKRMPVDWNLKRNRPFRQFRTIVNMRFEDGRSSFAGHYTFVRIPCGTQCGYFWMADLANGRLYESLTGEPVWADYVISKVDSRLVVFTGHDMFADLCRWAIYEWVETSKRFIPLKRGTTFGDCLNFRG